MEMMNKVENQVKNKGWGNILKEGVQVPTDNSDADLQTPAGGTHFWAFHQVYVWKTWCERVSCRGIDFYPGDRSYRDWKVVDLWICKWIVDVCDS